MFASIGIMVETLRGRGGNCEGNRGRGGNHGRCRNKGRGRGNIWS